MIKMADENREPRVWSLEEIDALLEDSGIVSHDIPETEPEPVKKAEAVDPRPIHSENVEHKIKSPDVERSDSGEQPQVYGAFTSDKYRDRFFNRPVQNIEKTCEHQIVTDEKYERAGFVKRKSDFESTADFEPIPNLVSADILEEENTESEPADQRTKTVVLRKFAQTDGNAHEEPLPQEEDDAQLSLEGFNFEEPVEKVDEREVEENLIKSRKHKVDNFVVVTEEKDEPADKTVKFGSEEYMKEDDKFKVAYFIRKRKKSALIAAIADAVIFVLLLAISVYANAAASASKLAAVISLVLLAAACGISYSAILNGAKSIIGFKLNRDTGCFAAIFAAFVQLIVFCIVKDPFDSGVTLFTAAAVVPLAMNMFAEFSEQGRIGKNFEIISSNELCSIGKIEHPETAFEIGRGLLLDEPGVICSQKTKFPKRFLELSRKFYPSDDTNKKVVPVVCAAALLVAAVTALVCRSLVASVSAFTAAVCVGVPYFAYLSDILSISSLCAKLGKKGAVIAGWDAFSECAGANAVAVDSSDIFDAEGGNIFGIHIFYDMKVDDAIIDTAALTVASGGPLGNLFKRVVLGKTELLPPVDTLAYEDKLGLSAWIFNRRVLVGSADLLKNHNVEIPEKHYVDKHIKDGRYPLYLAIDGKAAAVFIVSYDISESSRKQFRNLERNGLSLLVRSDDANITDELVAAGLDLPQSYVKVLSAVSGEVYKTYCGTVTTAADAGLMHDGKASSFLAAVSGALSLGSARHISRLFQAGAAGIGVAIVAVLAFVSGLQQLGCVQLVLTQAIFTAVSLAAVKFVKN